MVMRLLGSKKLVTSRLILRSTEESDLKTLWEILCIPEVNKYYLNCKLNFNWEEELPWQMKKLAKAKNPDVFCWSIILKENNECIGQITVQEKEGYPSDIRDIGWFINPKYQRKGYASETARKIIDYMFDEVGIIKILTGAAIANPASWRLMEKLGFKRLANQNRFVKYTFIPKEVEAYTYELSKGD